MNPTRMPEAMKAHFTMNDGVVPMEAWTAGMTPYPGEDALANLTSNVGAALVKRPEGLEIAERQAHHGRAHDTHYGVTASFSHARTPIVARVSCSQYEISA